MIKKLMLISLTIFACFNMHAMWKRSGWESQEPTRYSPSKYEQWRDWFVTKRRPYPTGISTGRDYIYQAQQKNAAQAPGIYNPHLFDKESHQAYKDYSKQYDLLYDAERRAKLFHHIPLNPYGFNTVERTNPWWYRRNINLYD